jgi:hypothetical protein
MMRKTIAACEIAGSVLPTSCRRSSIRTDGWSETFGEDYGEERFRLYGRVAGRLFVIAYARRETATIISARQANARERDRYGAD